MTVLTGLTAKAQPHTHTRPVTSLHSRAFSVCLLCILYSATQIVTGPVHFDFRIPSPSGPGVTSRSLLDILGLTPSPEPPPSTSCAPIMACPWACLFFLCPVPPRCPQISPPLDFFSFAEQRFAPCLRACSPFSSLSLPALADEEGRLVSLPVLTAGTARAPAIAATTTSSQVIHPTARWTSRS